MLLDFDEFESPIHTPKSSGQWTYRVVSHTDTASCVRLQTYYYIPCFSNIAHAFAQRLFCFISSVPLKGNVQRSGRKFLGHFIRHFRSQISESSKQGQIKRVNPKCVKKEEKFYHIILCLSVDVCTFQYSNIWSRSSFWVTVQPCTLSDSWVLIVWCRQNNQSVNHHHVLRSHPIYRIIKLTFVENVGFIC